MVAYASVFRAGLFAGDVVLITGGGSGLGRCIAHELAALGATVVLAGRRAARLERVADEVRRLGGCADTAVMNIRDAKVVAAAVESVVAKHGRIHALVNNAGGQFASPAAHFSTHGWTSVVDLNLNGTWHVTKAVFDACMREHGGRIVCMVADYFAGMPMMAHTGAARAGVDNMVKSLAVEWAPLGIRINAVAPGTILGSGMLNYPDAVLQHVAQRYASQNPSRRLGTEAEVSSAVCYLLSPAASYVNGHCLRVCGGASLAKGAMLDSVPHDEPPKIMPYMGLPEGVDTQVPPQLHGLLARYAAMAKL